MSVASLLAVQAVEAQPSGCDSLVGIWDYVDPSPAGRAIIARLGNKYTLVYFQTARPAAVPAGSAVGRNFFGGVHEYTCEGSSGKYRLKMRALHSHRPEDVGPEVVLDMEVQGDRSKWWFIEPDGKRINPGAASRVK
jgi:hypothetical protein